MSDLGDHGIRACIGHADAAVRTSSVPVENIPLWNKVCVTCGVFDLEETVRYYIHLAQGMPSEFVDVTQEHLDMASKWITLAMAEDRAYSVIASMGVAPDFVQEDIASAVPRNLGGIDDEDLVNVMGLLGKGMATETMISTHARLVAVTMMHVSCGDAPGSSMNWFKTEMAKSDSPVHRMCAIPISKIDGFVDYIMEIGSKERHHMSDHYFDRLMKEVVVGDNHVWLFNQSGFDTVYSSVAAKVHVAEVRAEMVGNLADVVSRIKDATAAIDAAEDLQTAIGIAVSDIRGRANHSYNDWDAVVNNQERLRAAIGTNSGLLNDSLDILARAREFRIAHEAAARVSIRGAMIPAHQGIEMAAYWPGLDERSFYRSIDFGAYSTRVGMNFASHLDDSKLAGHGISEPNG
jgi:hypothetical protein